VRGAVADRSDDQHANQIGNSATVIAIYTAYGEHTWILL
jgi:hypothetical protein